MFTPIMKKYQLYKPVLETNDYGEKVYSYQADRIVEAAIVLDTNYQYQSNDSNITDVTLIGLSKDRQIKKNDKIDNYLVTFVEINRLYSIVHMKEVDNVGKYNNRD